MHHPTSYLDTSLNLHTRSREPASPGRPRSRENVAAPINDDACPGRTILSGTPRSTAIVRIQQGCIRIQTRVVLVVVAPSSRRPRRCRCCCCRRVARQWWRPTATMTARRVRGEDRVRPGQVAFRIIVVAITMTGGLLPPSCGTSSSTTAYLCRCHYRRRRHLLQRRKQRHNR